MKSSNKKTILEFKKITKVFLGGKIIANDNISLKIERNEIHSIIGENGSGKSTLMSILFGLYKQDFGDIFINDKKVDMYGAGAAKKHKIGMVHQHFHLVNEFSVLDNILIGQEKSSLKFLGIISKTSALKKFKEISLKYHLNLDPKKIVRKLSVGDRQKVEIFKVLWEEKDIIIFDEPTSTLSIVEVEKLMITIKKLKSEGKTILFISHKMKEVKEISDNISILRKGKLIFTRKNTPSLTPELIAKEMIGEVVKLEFKRKYDYKKNQKILDVQNISYITSKGFKALNSISFDVREGEIFGLIGIQGNGQEEILEIISGIKKSSSGIIKFNSKENILEQQIFQRNKYIANIPSDRAKYGIVLNEDLAFNSIISTFEEPEFTIPFLNKKIQIIDKAKIKKWTDEIITKGDVQGAKDHIMPIRDLSGGNQQKFVIARELFRKNKILLAGHPTRGLDIKAINKIYKNMIAKTESKKTSIILYSLELSELMAVCDRAAILYHGKIVDIIEPKKINITKVSQMMIGYSK